MNYLNKSLAISFAILTPLVVAVGAYYTTVITPILLIIATIVVVVLVALDKIKGKIIYLYIFGIALGFVWQTTMLGADVVGSDIHIEYYFAQVNYSQPWDLSYPDASNTSVVIGFLAPWLSKLLMLDMLWVFKLVLPVFLACMPLVLFKAFELMFGEKRAFFAVMFFLIIPVYSLEIAQIAKSMVAELFLAFMILAVVSSWKWHYKFLGIAGSLVLMVVCHYTIAIMGICFLIGAFVVRLVTIPFKWELLANRMTPIFVLFISIVIGVGSFWVYHGYAANAAGMRSIKEVGLGITAQYLSKPGAVESMASANEPQTSQAEAAKPRVKTIIEKMDESPKLVKIGTGFDFDEVPVDGKLFRITQYLTQLLILAGGGWLLYKHKYYKPSVEYLGFATASFILLLMCIMMPSVAIIINMTRFYHLSLFFLAPCFVLGIEMLSFRKE